ncbi:LPXTG cell wall anchor domain-containing protein [Enterococcus sp. LJL51]|uniref:LPXTG cell wall anchor domain-containing protein n=1 Tax=Enterococcus sp. LJL51 TaxID=3416656 RepID=UPI003CEF52AC
MIKKNKFVALSLSSIVMTALLLIPLKVSAEAVNGGQVATESVITFYEDEYEQKSSSSSNSMSTEDSSSKVIVAETAKPSGKLPNTGDLVQGSIGISGILLLVGALLLFVRKKQGGKAS